MFWDSVFGGLKVLSYWETYVAGVEYLAIFFIPMIITGTIMEKSQNSGWLIGCLSMLFMPVFQVAAMAVMILSISPIIFGLSDDAAWSLPWILVTMAPGLFFKLVVTLVIASIVLAFIPILSRFQSLQTMVLGGIVLMFVLGIVNETYPGVVIDHVDLIPDFWFSVGLITIGGIMAWIALILVALIIEITGMAEESIGQLLMAPIPAILGFIPVFMYGAWLGAQIRAML